MRVVSFRCWLSVAVATLGCSSQTDPGARPADAGSAGSDTAAAADTGGMAAADPDAVIGAFDIRLVAADPGSAMSAPTPAFVAIQGRVSSSARPPLLTLETTSREGDCLIEIPSAPFCDACRDGICVKGGKCLPHPQPRSVGTVTLTGLATAGDSAPLTMAPEPPQYFYQTGGDVKINYPPFAEGAPVRLSASGGELPGFEIAAKGTVPLEVTSPTPVMMERGKPMALRWKAATMAGISRLGIVVDISHHGGFKGQITCDVPDTGSYDVPATLVGKLMDLGIAGYPTTTLTRRSAAHAQLPAGRVELNILSSHILPIVIPGYVSCSENDPCPAGKTCGQDGLCK